MYLLQIFCKEIAQWHFIKPLFYFKHCARHWNYRNMEETCTHRMYSWRCQVIQWGFSPRKGEGTAPGGPEPRVELAKLVLRDDGMMCCGWFCWHLRVWGSAENWSWKYRPDYNAFCTRSGDLEFIVTVTGSFKKTTKNEKSNQICI